VRSPALWKTSGRSNSELLPGTSDSAASSEGRSKEVAAMRKVAKQREKQRQESKRAKLARKRARKQKKNAVRMCSERRCPNRVLDARSKGLCDKHYREKERLRSRQRRAEGKL
jgi:hypothetical protein